MGEEVYDDANHCWHFSKIQNWIGMWTSNSVSRHIPKEWKAKTLVDACILIHSNTVAKGRGSHCVHWWKTHCSDYVQECSDACGNVYALWRKGQLWKGKYYMVLLFFIYIYGSSYKRYLVWPCSQGQGIKHWLSRAGRKTHEDLQFDGSTLSVLRMLYNVNAANPTEVSTHKWLW